MYVYVYIYIYSCFYIVFSHISTSEATTSCRMPGRRWPLQRAGGAAFSPGGFSNGIPHSQGFIPLEYTIRIGIWGKFLHE